MPVPTLVLSAVLTSLLLVGVRAQTPPALTPDPELTPSITGRELHDALGLEIAKLRVEHIPAGTELSLELVEWSGKGVRRRTRRLGSFCFRPATDWAEVLVSALDPDGAGCRRLHVEVRHEHFTFWRWPVEMEARFGRGVRAHPPGQTGYLHFGTHAARFEEGTQIQLASFRVSGRPGRHCILQLNDYGQEGLAFTADH